MPPRAMVEGDRPRHAPGLVRPPERSERVAGTRTGTAWEPVARRQRRASSRPSSTSGPANCVIAYDGSASAVSASARPTSAGSTGCSGDAAEGRMPSLAVVANACATSVWNCVARTIVHGTPPRGRLLLRELQLVVGPADPVDAHDRDEHVMLHAGLAPARSNRRCRRRAPCDRRWRRRGRPPRRRARPRARRRREIHGGSRRGARGPVPRARARRARAPPPPHGSGSAHDRDPHGPRTNQTRAM